MDIEKLAERLGQEAYGSDIEDLLSAEQFNCTGFRFKSAHIISSHGIMVVGNQE